MATLKELRDERIKKLNKLKEMGIKPYPSQAAKTADNKDVAENFEKYEGKELTLTGRIMSLRTHGQLIFADIHDESGKIQLYIKDTELKQTDVKKQLLGFEDLNLLDIGDFIQAMGTVTKTKSGEVSLQPKELKLLTKSLRPLPDKREGLKDQDTIFRRRYLDLAINPERREMFTRKAVFWTSSREFLKEKGFIEMEVPIMEHVTGGADANPFVTHHDALDEDFYLRISTELFQKRLIGGGFEKVYTLGPNFRNEGLSDEHLQEYYQLEWYWAYANYRDNMELAKELFRHVAKEVYGKTSFEKGSYKFDLADEWEELDYSTVIKERFGVDVFETSDDEILNILKENKVKLPGNINRARLVDNLWKLIRKDIAGPAFLVNQPKFISPLAKSLPENEKLTERYQIIIAGSELANGYSELNDPYDQLERFMEQQGARDMGDAEAQMLDIDFVEMLEYGMPPTSGHGHSERLFWFFENITAREGTLFPQMRRKVDEVTREIYGIRSEEQKKEEKPELKEEEKKETAEAPMEKANFDIDSGEKLLSQMVKDDYQVLHARMVAEGLKTYANKLGEDENLWYLTGLLHDLDYFTYPEDHPNIEMQWYKKWGFPEEFIHAVAAHNYKRSGIQPESKLAAALIATDELAGFMYAYSLMRPEGFKDMGADSIKKKFKDKAFAKKVDREEILFGIEKFGVDFKEHIETLITAFRKMPEFN